MGEEGCLSFPGIYGDVAARRRASASATATSTGGEREMVLEDFVARVFLHELDHLDGRVFIDRMTPASREARRAAARGAPTALRRADRPERRPGHATLRRTRRAALARTSADPS